MDMSVNEPLLVSSNGEYGAYDRYLVIDAAGRGDWITAQVRIGMALFMLILCLLVDSSRESFGLAAFLGFQAIGLSLDYGWLPIIKPRGLWFFVDWMAISFLYYYVLHLTRFVRLDVGRWTVVSAAVLAPFAAYYHDAPSVWVGRMDDVQAYVTIAVTCFGVMLCVRAFSFLYGKQLRWRLWAVSIAGVACMQQMLTPLATVWPDVMLFDWWATLANMSDSVAPYLLTLSAFINISSLENRVRLLSAAQARAEMLRQELQLGQAVQHAFMTPPKMPADFEIAAFQSAPLLVSGDTYFAHWNDTTDRLTIVLSDLVGHGIHAALRASASQVIAKTIWSFPELNANAENGTPIELYNTLLQRFLNERGEGEGGAAAIVGCELVPERRVLRLYRHNAVFPLLLQTNPAATGPRYLPQLVAQRNSTVQEVAFNPGDFVILLTDGILADSRDMLRFVNAVGALPLPRDGIGAADLKDLLLSVPALAKGRNLEDDGTLLVVHWRRAAGEAVNAPDSLGEAG